MNRGLLLAVSVAGGILLLCLIAAGIAAISNRGLDLAAASPSKHEDPDLAPLDKARLGEALRLKRDLGEEIWPGWGQAEMPFLVWNQTHSYLIGYPAGQVPPTPWEPISGDHFQGQTYYVRPTEDPQNFAVRVGDRWTASLATKSEMDAFLIEMIAGVVPATLKPIVPYRLLIQPSEVQLTGVLHESFHVYQARVAPERLAAAEAAHSRGSAYWATDEAMHKAWKSEIDLLEQALKANSDTQALESVRRFLEQRARRRREAGLDASLVDYERQLEWEEGLAKYVELAAWRAAHESPDYAPVPELASDPDFKGYRAWERRWSQEIGQMKRQAAREGEPRFYYTGMTQAMLLDRLLPGWKARALDDSAWLETLLAEVAN